MENILKQETHENGSHFKDEYSDKAPSPNFSSDIKYNYSSVPMNELREFCADQEIISQADMNCSLS